MRRRRTQRAAAAAAVLIATAVGCSGGGTPTARPTAAAAAAGCDAAPPAPAAGYPLGQRTVLFVDPTRTTPADPGRHLAAKPDRVLPVTLFYPSLTGAPTGAPTVGTPPAPGAFPLVVASHGVLSSGRGMATKARAWAAAGYVVAAPTYPLSSGPGATIADLPRQPGDVAFVVRSLRTMVAGTDPLHGHVAVDCLALAGHSLGAATTLEATYESGFRVPGVKAAISMSGLLAPIPPGSFTRPPPVPVLLVHGDKDNVVAYANSQAAFRELTGPRYLLTLRGADHNSIFAAPYEAVLDAAAVAFLDAEVKGRPAALAALGGPVADSGVATLQSHR